MAKRHYGRVLLGLVLCVTMVLSGCSTNWIDEASQIVAVLIPAAENLVTLVAMLQGKNVSAVDLETIQNAGKETAADFQLIQSLIAAYEKADASAKPGILNEIQSAIGAAQANLQGLLAGLHIKDAATQTKITAVVGIVLSEVQSLAALVPIVENGQLARFPTVAEKSAASMGHPVGTGRARVPLSAGEFVRSFNSTLTAKTGNAELDRATSLLQIHLHSSVERIASAGVLK